MPAIGLSDPQRRSLLGEIRAALLAAHPARAQSPTQTMKLGQIEQHLDCLVAIARRLNTERLEPELAMLLDDVCPTCQFQFASGYCPLRSVSGCLLYRDAEAVFHAIKLALPSLAELNDEARQ